MKVLTAQGGPAAAGPFFQVPFNQSVVSCTANNVGRAFYNNGILYQNSDSPFADITDGTANTYILGEQRYQLLDGGRPDTHWLGWASTNRGGGSAVTGTLSAAQLPINVFDGHGDRFDTTYGSAGSAGVAPAPGHGLHQRSFGSYHPGGCFFGMADGSVQFENETMDILVYWARAVRDDGLSVQ